MDQNLTCLVLPSILLSIYLFITSTVCTNQAELFYQAAHELDTIIQHFPEDKVKHIRDKIHGLIRAGGIQPLPQVEKTNIQKSIAIVTGKNLPSDFKKFTTTTTSTTAKHNPNTDSLLATSPSSSLIMSPNNGIEVGSISGNVDGHSIASRNQVAKNLLNVKRNSFTSPLNESSSQTISLNQPSSQTLVDQPSSSSSSSSLSSSFSPQSYYSDVKATAPPFYDENDSTITTTSSAIIYNNIGNNSINHAGYSTSASPSYSLIPPQPPSLHNKINYDSTGIDSSIIETVNKNNHADGVSNNDGRSRSGSNSCENSRRSSSGGDGTMICRALYNNVAEEVDELNFKAGDLIELIEIDQSGWWKGRLLNDGSVGVFPSNYVEIVDS